MTKALKLKQGEGYIVLRTDTVCIVSCEKSNGRNISCVVNGMLVDEGLDFVLKALEWDVVTPDGKA